MYINCKCFFEVTCAANVHVQLKLCFIEHARVHFFVFRADKICV